MRYFRLGQQTCFFSYLNRDISAIEGLLAGIRQAAPDLKTLHIDNADPLAVASKSGARIAKLVAEYCTEGNCAPMGIESFDPAVIDANTLTCTPEVLMRAVGHVNEAGAHTGPGGLPVLLPGLNLIYGLPGETHRTHYENLAGLVRILDDGLLCHRINVRQARAHPGTPLAAMAEQSPPPSAEHFDTWKADIAQIFDEPMKRRVYPTGRKVTGMHSFFVTGRGTWHRRLGSYPSRSSSLALPDRCTRPPTWWSPATRPGLSTENAMPQPETSHVGVLVPWANTVVETELPGWGGERVAWHYARLVPPGGGTALDEDFLSGLVDAMPCALHQLSRLPLERVYLACTSAAFTRPDRVQAAADGMPVVTAFDVITAALRRRDASAIALATPYPHSVTEVEVAQFDAQGIRVTGAASLGVADGYAHIGSAEIEELVLGIGAGPLKAADAIVLSCTGWPTRSVIGSLRRRLARPVLSSNSAIATHALEERP